MRMRCIAMVPINVAYSSFVPKRTAINDAVAAHLQLGAELQFTSYGTVGEHFSVDEPNTPATDDVVRGERPGGASAPMRR